MVNHIWSRCPALFPKHGILMQPVRLCTFSNLRTPTLHSKLVGQLIWFRSFFSNFLDVVQIKYWWRLCFFAVSVVALWVIPSELRIAWLRFANLVLDKSALRRQLMSAVCSIASLFLPFVMTSSFVFQGPHKSVTANIDSIIIIVINDYECYNWVAICLCQGAHQIKIKPIQDHVTVVQFCAATFKEWISLMREVLSLAVSKQPLWPQ